MADAIVATLAPWSPAAAAAAPTAPAGTTEVRAGVTL
jgi:hypothetical protein